MKKSIEKKLTVTKHKVSKLWVGYRKEKKKVLKNKRLSSFEKSGLLAEKRGEIKLKISDKWKDYQEVKYGIVHKSPYKNTIFTKKLEGVEKFNKKKGIYEFHVFENSYQKIYKIKGKSSDDKIKNLKIVLPDIISRPNVKGILIVFVIHNENTGLNFTVSNFINKQLFEGIDNIENYVLDVLDNHVTGFGDYCFIKNIQLRVLYEKPKGINTKK